MDVELFGDEDGKASEVPVLPIFVGEAEHVFAGQDGHGVDGEGGGEIFVDPAEHLVRLVDFDGLFAEAVIVPQSGDGVDVDAGDGGAAEVDGDAVWGLVGERGGDASGTQGRCGLHGGVSGSIVAFSLLTVHCHL